MTFSPPRPPSPITHRHSAPQGSPPIIPPQVPGRAIQQNPGHVICGPSDTTNTTTSSHRIDNRRQSSSNKRHALLKGHTGKEKEGGKKKRMWKMPSTKARRNAASSVQIPRRAAKKKKFSKNWCSTNNKSETEDGENKLQQRRN